MKYVIIGSSIAAAGALQGIRSIDRTGAISLVDGEGRGIYSRPLISSFLADPVARADINYTPATWLNKMNVEVVKGRAASINTRQKLVMLDDGGELEYDRLLLATGSGPVIPDIPGTELPHVVPFYTLADAERISNMARSARKAVVIGSGLIGVKAAEALQMRGIQVTIVEKEDRVLPRTLTPEAGRMVAGFLQDAGISVLTSCGVTMIEGEAVRVEQHGQLKADVVVMAVGVRPRTELATAAGIAVRRGIVVDPLMQTSSADVWAAGDVVETINRITGEPEIMALFPHAHRQGYVAGRNMAGDSICYEGGIPVNAVRLPGCLLLTAGHPGLPEATVLTRTRNQQLLQIGVRVGRITGFIALNLPEVAGVLHHAAQTGYTATLEEWASLLDELDTSAIWGKLWAGERSA